MNQKKLLRKTKQELMAIGREHGLKVRLSQKKEEIIDLLLNSVGKHGAHNGDEEETTTARREPSTPQREAIVVQRETAAVQRKIQTEERPFPIAEARPQASPPPAEMPQAYGHTHIVLMARDPWWIHAYWEITPSAYDEARAKLEPESYGALTFLRAYELSGGRFDGNNATKHYDVEVTGGAKNWYLNVGNPGKTYCVDVGLMSPSGRFVTIARSNVVITPRATISDVLDEEWMSSESEFEKVYAMSGGFDPGRSSLELKEMFEQSLQEESASGALASMASGALYQRPRGFRFVVDAELIVYGATEPDARVYIQGKRVPLRGDGTFTLRYALPDGHQDIDAVAISGDDIECRKAIIKVNRATERHEPFVKPTWQQAAAFK